MRAFKTGKRAHAGSVRFAFIEMEGYYRSPASTWFDAGGLTIEGELHTVVRLGKHRV
jgi:hypothetical protein